MPGLFIARAILIGVFCGLVAETIWGAIGLSLILGVLFTVNDILHEEAS